MKIENGNPSKIVEDAASLAAKNAVDLAFKTTQLNVANPEAHGTVTTTSAPVQVVGAVNSPLAGSAAEVFAKAGVISISEPTRATLTFESEHAAFKNSLIMYKLGPDGTIKEAQAIFPNASAMGSGGHLKDGQSAVHVDLQAGDQVAFAILPNGFANSLSKHLLTRPDGQLAMINWKGDPANLLTDNPNAIQLVHIDNFGNKQPISGEFGNKMFNSAGNASQGFVTNFDGNDHADQLVDAERGLILIGMDDLPRGEDAIRKNLLISLDVGKNNAMALNQNLIDDRPTSFRDMAGADFRASHAEIMATAQMYDEDGDGVLNAQEWAKFAPLLNLTQDDHKHFVGIKGRGDLDSLSYLISRGDVNGDGQLDEREILDLGRRLNGNDPSVIQSFREAAGVDWKLDYEEFISTAEHHDKNGDGLDQQEWNRFAPVLGLTPQDRNLFLKPSGQFDVEKFTSVFALADTNNSGQLNPREVIELRRIVLENFAPTTFPTQQPSGARNGQFPLGNSPFGFENPFSIGLDTTHELAQELMKVAIGDSETEEVDVEQPDALTFSEADVAATASPPPPVPQSVEQEVATETTPVVEQMGVQGRSFFNRDQEEIARRLFR